MPPLENLIGAALGAGIAIALIGYTFLISAFVQKCRSVRRRSSKRI